MSKELLFLLVAGTILQCSTRKFTTPADPCDNFCCPVGEYCFARPVPCPLSRIAPCPPPVATCIDPCKNYPYCEPGTVCVATKRKGERELRPVCRNPCHKYPCSAAETCMTTTDERNQTVPFCFGPCSIVRCAGTCVNDLYANGTAYFHCYPPPPRKYSPCYNCSRCPKTESCVVISSSICPQAPCPSPPATTCASSNPCDGKVCDKPGEYCYLAQVCKAGYSYPPVPYCSDPCKSKICAPGTVCVRQQYEDYKYSPYAVCQSPCDGVHCPITKKREVMTKNGQTICQCMGPCDRKQCSDRCVERIDKAGKAYGKCVSSPKPDPCSGCSCTGNQTCVLTTRAGNPNEFFAQCTINPCPRRVHEKNGKYCYAQQVTCIRAPCYPVREYRTPCQNVKCGPGTKCVVKKFKCKSGYCPPQGQCE